MDPRAPGYRHHGRIVDTSEWHELQYWLTDGECRVEVPFAGVLADLIPPIAVRLRRDFGSVLGLVRAHALLHRATRSTDEDGRVLATLDDYAVVRELVDDLISDGIGGQVSPSTRETVNAVAEITTNPEARATNAQLAQKLKLDRSAVTRRVRKAVEQGYLVNEEDRPRKPTRLKIGDPLPEDQVILPERETVEDALCACAVDLDPTQPPTDVDGDPTAKLLRDADSNVRRSEFAAKLRAQRYGEGA